MLGPDLRYAELVAVAKSFVGTREETTNWSPVIEMFQKEINGRAEREPWCCCFVQYCVRETDRRIGIQTCVFPTESVVELWKRTPLWARTDDPFPGCLMLWWHFKDGKPTGAGHIGIMEAVDRGRAVRYRTIEGNTGPDLSDGTVNRDGDGVFERYRNPVGSPSMRVLGYIDPWAQPPEEASKS
jgi:hypothetical protein